MLAYTVKASVKLLRDYGVNKKILLELKESGKLRRNLEFMIENGTIIAAFADPNSHVKVSHVVKDIEMMELSGNYSLTKFSYKSTHSGREPYVEHTASIKYEAHFLQELFKLMKDRAVFTVVSNKVHYNCYFVNGRLYYVDNTDNRYRVVETELSKLHFSLPNYRVLTINPLSPRYDFLEDHANIAKVTGKEFVRYRDGQLV